MAKKLKEITGHKIFSYKDGNRNFWLLTADIIDAEVTWNLYTESLAKDATHSFCVWGGGTPYRLVYRGEFEQFRRFDDDFTSRMLEEILRQFSSIFIDLFMGMAQSATPVQTERRTFKDFSESI